VITVGCITCMISCIESVLVSATFVSNAVPSSIAFLAKDFVTEEIRRSLFANSSFFGRANASDSAVLVIWSMCYSQNSTEESW